MDVGAISSRGLSRAFASGPALVDLDLDVGSGQVLALLGPNGAGKTTTVRLLNGILRPDAGTATVLGLDPWADGEAVRRRTGVLTEQAGLDERFTAMENLVLAARLRGFSADEGRRRAGDLLERLGMGDRVDTVVQGFSTGQRKRVALARALLHEPDLLFLDEPTSGLDPSATKGVVEMIADLAREHGRTVVLCTHFLGEAGRLADRMAVLFHGRLQAEGTPAEIARRLWGTRRTEVDLGHAATPEVVALLARVPGSEAVEATDTGIAFEAVERAVVADAVATLVGSGRAVFGVHTHEPTLEDVYFAVEARALRGDDAEVTA